MKKNNSACNDDFMSKVSTMITERSEKISTLTGEIEKLKSSIDNLKNKVNSFSDVNDVSSYSRLKGELQSNKDRLELLERNLKAVKSSFDGVQAREIYRDFEMKVSEINQKCEASILPRVMEIKAICDGASEEKAALQRLFDAWRYTLPSSGSEIPSMLDMADVTGTTTTVTRMINTFAQSGKI